MEEEYPQYTVVNISRDSSICPGETEANGNPGVLLKCLCTDSLTGTHAELPRRDSVKEVPEIYRNKQFCGF